MPGRIPEHTIEEVRSRSDIVAVIDGYVPLKKRGADFWACCPFHKEKTPSFKVSLNHQTYYCFGCKKSGNVFRFVMEMENIDFVGAIRLLAQRAGIFIPEEPVPAAAGRGRGDRQLTKEQMFQVLTAAAAWYQKQLKTSEADAARTYLSDRGLDENAITDFGLGYAPNSWDALMSWGKGQGFSPELLITAGLLIQRENSGAASAHDRFRGRLMFPICDELGRTVGFSGRILEKDTQAAKYINTPETPVFHKGRILYGLHLARQQFKEAGNALVCEGQLDVIACHRAGLKFAVAPQGTAFTETQAHLLKRFTDAVVFAFDADEAGEKAAVRSIEVALAADLQAAAVVLPKNRDPDDIFRHDGADKLREVMAARQEALDFLLTVCQRDCDGNTAAGRDAVVRRMLQTISSIGRPVARAAHCQWLSHRLGIPEHAVFEAMNNLLRGQRRQARYQRAATASATTADDAAAAFSSTPSPVEPALLSLLDLALHCGPIAHQLAENETLTPQHLGNSAVEKALLLVLQKTAEDDWLHAAAAIGADEELASTPAIAEVLHRSRYKNIDPDMEEKARQRAEAVLRKAMEDCLAVLEKFQIEHERHLLSDRLEKETDPAEARKILAQLHQLAQHKERLTRAGK